MHLFVDISSHGFGHLAISAPVINRLAQITPQLRLTIRSALPAGKLAERIQHPFSHIPERSDLGCAMHNATHVDHAATADSYRKFHANWPQKVAAEAHLLRHLGIDLLLSNIAYLPLAGAAQAGIPALAICSLNWADVFAHYFAAEDWAAPIHADILSAYRAARRFLRITPGMPMPTLGNLQHTGPVATLGKCHDLDLGKERAVLISLGGIQHRLPIETWPRLPGIRWLVSRDWQCRHPDAIAYESFNVPFTDLLCSVDAVITKPGYGTFSEACCNGTPLLYVRREDWPEQACLIDWLQAQGNCREISPQELASGNLGEALHALWAMPARARPASTGIEEAARIIQDDLLAAVQSRH